MSQACGDSVPEPENPGLVLGAALAELTLAKRDKITFLCSPSLTAFPAWTEQLIAESTGKDRKGIVPVAGEKLGAPEKYGADRVFVYLRHEGDENHELDRQIAALQANGHPVFESRSLKKLTLARSFSVGSLLSPPPEQRLAFIRLTSRTFSWPRILRKR